MSVKKGFIGYDLELKNWFLYDFINNNLDRDFNHLIIKNHSINSKHGMITRKQIGSEGMNPTHRRKLNKIMDRKIWFVHVVYLFWSSCLLQTKKEGWNRHKEVVFFDGSYFAWHRLHVFVLTAAIVAAWYLSISSSQSQFSSCEYYLYANLPITINFFYIISTIFLFLKTLPPDYPNLPLNKISHSLFGRRLIIATAAATTTTGEAEEAYGPTSFQSSVSKINLNLSRISFSLQD